MIHSFSFNDESTVWIPPSIVGNSLSIFVWKRLLTTRVRNTGGLWRSKSIHTYLNKIEPNIWTKRCTVSWDIGVFKSGGSGWGVGHVGHALTRLQTRDCWVVGFRKRNGFVMDASNEVIQSCRCCSLCVWCIYYKGREMNEYCFFSLNTTIITNLQRFYSNTPT